MSENTITLYCGSCGDLITDTHNHACTSKHDRSAVTEAIKEIDQWVFVKNDRSGNAISAAKILRDEVGRLEARVAESKITTEAVVTRVIRSFKDGLNLHDETDYFKSQAVNEVIDKFACEFYPASSSGYGWVLLLRESFILACGYLAPHNPPQGDTL